MNQKNKKPLQMTTGLWIGFTMFGITIAVLFGVIFYMSFQKRYTREYLEKLQDAAWTLTEKYNPETFSENIKLMAKSGDYFVQYVSEEDCRILQSVTNEGEDGKVPQEILATEEIFHKLDDSEGFCLYYTNDTSRNITWAVEAVVVASDHGYRQVLVIGKSMVALESLKHLLFKRYIMVFAAVIGFAVVLSVVMANYFSKPFRILNQRAGELAQGNFDTEFPQDGPEEACRLADTLTHAEQEFAATEALRRDFVANISHDMKTPLAIIRLYAEMLDSFSADIPEKRTEHLQKIISETDRLSDFITDLLELARLQSGTLQLVWSEFSVCQLAKEMISHLNAKYDGSETDIRLDAEEDYLVCGDRKLIGRVFYNFINNAVKYSGEEKKVNVRITSEKEAEVMIRIQDFGIGIPQDQLAYIWQRYYQVTPHKADNTGMGMGLNIVSEILKSHHAPYGVESCEGKGSTFWFVLKKSEARKEEHE